MESCRTDAIGAVNSYLRQMKEEKDSEGRVSLIIFDSQSIDVIRAGVPAATCAELEAREYEPRASTPLLDAVAEGVRVLDTKSNPAERRVLAIMTDGLENASKEHTKETIKALLERKQKDEGWLVVYLGTGHDAWAQAGQMGLAAGNVMHYARSRTKSTIVQVMKRQQRYAAADDAAAEALTGGFTEAERAEVSEKPGKAS